MQEGHCLDLAPRTMHVWTYACCMCNRRASMDLRVDALLVCVCVCASLWTRKDYTNMFPEPLWL